MHKLPIPVKLKLKRWQIMTIVSGLLIFFVGIFAYQLGLSASRGYSTGKVALLMAGTVLILVGAMGRKLLDLYKAIALILLNTIVLLIAIELGLSVFARLNDFLPGSQPRETHQSNNQYVGEEGRKKLPYYQEQEWGRVYWREYDAAWEDRSHNFDPYLLWRNEPFKGETININSNGLRVTPGADCTPDSYKVFTFGGSTMWGTGVPDWGTIPAFLQSELAKQADQPVCVVNYSEQAWVSTQSVIQLILALRAERIPDLVIFYDGNNDIFAAYQHGKAGVPQNLNSLIARFENRPVENPLIQLVSNTKTYKTLMKLVFGEEYDKPQNPYKLNGVDTSFLVDEIASTYLGNIDIVNALAEANGFDAFFFWQTILLVDEKQLTEDELSYKSVAVNAYPGFTELYRMTSEQVLESASHYPHLYSLMNIFKGRSEFTFVDPIHVTIEGNQLIAEEMLKLIHGR